jgi:predicted negative regulator of RcsB-dependent stress response
VDTQTRHALKQDRLVDATRTSVDWFQENRSRVITAAVAVLICLAIVVVGLVLYGKRSAAADLAFGEAMDTYNAPLAQPGQPPTPGEKTFATAADRARLANQQFVQIANQYGLFESGKTARYFAGITAIDMGQTGPAETYLKKVVDGHDAALASLAKLALANLYQQTNRNSQAVDLLQQLIAKPTNTVPADAARLQLAALYEKTNPAEANRLYAQLKSSKSAAGQIAAQKLQQK